MTGLLRTEYLNVNLGTVRTGATGHGESLTDLESYLLPMASFRDSALHTWGVAGGLRVAATAGQAGLTVAPGVALDGTGRLIVLAPDGLAVVDPATDPTDLPNITTVPMPAAGLTFATTGLTGLLLLTVTWLEALGTSAVANAPALLHAPWIRLVPGDGFGYDGSQVVLATVDLAADSTVVSLAADGRRATGTPTGSLQVSRPAADSAAPGTGIAETLSAQVVGRDGGGLSFQLPTGPQPASTALFLDDAGNLGLGIGDGPAARRLHVEGSELHSGSGYSFSDRAVQTFVEVPDAGQRWVWYAQDGVARLWSGSDRLWVSASGEGGGLDVGRRMRVRQGGDSSAGIWLFQDGPQSDRAFVGMSSDAMVGFYGASGGWGLQMNVNTLALTFAGDYGTPGGPATLSLWASRIGDIGNGSLFLRSGGSVVAFDGGDFVGIGISTPNAPLHVLTASAAIAANIQGSEHAIWATGGSGYGAVLRGAGGLNVSGSSTAIWAQGPVMVNGVLLKNGGGFRIDHPNDPANKYLSHSFVESPDMLNLYHGTATTDAEGRAVVHLPDYFAALNRDLSYQLTVIGSGARAWVEQEVADERFSIRTDAPATRVAWLVLGVRNDAWARAHRIPVAEEKPAHERGRYLTPEAHGQPKELLLSGLPTDV